MTKASKLLSGLQLIILTVFGINVAHAGWFGPSDTDKAKVTVKVGDHKLCPGKVTLDTFNGSSYRINVVAYTVRAQIPGHSTLYRLNPGDFSFPIEDDTIIEPNNVRHLCVVVNWNEIPQGLKEVWIFPEIVRVDFAEK